ncbi:MAG: division/cell wall cluster transcriptional repressor MraZ [Flavobacteriales bacterium]|nr:division/cell wall cluster transcriptional repressor MraZ [Flavobacteriales bacterium]NNK80288.1 division/cell wall cluster transcriptional repressor MraZ [Flavobacteriales bacterium]
MLNLLGEYDCKLDAKGRMMLPRGLKKQLEDCLHEGFVVNRDIFSKALVVYPWKVWQDLSAQVNKLNKFKRKNVLFIRKFNSGATRIELDGQGRLLLPSALLGYAEVEKEVKLNALTDRVELWSKKNYEQMLEDDIDMATLSEEVMGDVGNELD